MTGTLADRVGFEHPNRRDPSPPRPAAPLELITSVALAVSTVVVVAVVSIGIARADALAAAPAAERSFAVAVLLGVIFAGWGGLTALMTRNGPPHNG